MPRPYVLLSVAQSLDGYIDDPSPDRLVLSSPEDLDRVDEVRAGCDAIMVGAVTLRRDNPRLRVKSPERRAARKARGLPEELLRVIVTRSGKLGRDLRVWTSAGEKIIYCPDTAAGALRETLGDLAVVAGQGDTVDLGALLDDLGARGIGRLVVEGGEQVHTQFLAADLADELHVTIGGFFVADPAAPRFVTPGVRLPQNAARRMQLIEVSKAGETAVLRYLVRPKALSSPSRVPTHAMPPSNSAGRVVFAAVCRCRTHRAGRRMSRFGNDRVYLLRDPGRRRRRADAGDLAGPALVLHGGQRHRQGHLPGEPGRPRSAVGRAAAAGPPSRRSARPAPSRPGVSRPGVSARGSARGYPARGYPGGAGSPFLAVCPGRRGRGGHPCHPRARPP